MDTPVDIVGQAIDSVDKLRRSLSRGSSKQVTAKKEKVIIQAVAKAWINSLRPRLLDPAIARYSAEPQKKYDELLTYSDKSISRSVYLLHLKELKNDLIRFRSQINILGSAGQISIHGKPELSKLVKDPSLLTIIDRRWDEIERCIENAPFTAVIMIGALLEALLFSRIERETDKSPLFKLNCTPKDKRGNPKDFGDWCLNDYLNVCSEMRWIGPPVKEIGKVIRDYRNLIHPREELNRNISIGTGDAKLFWAIFSTIAEEITNSVRA